MYTKLSFGQSIKADFMAGLVVAGINAALFYIFHATGTIRDTMFVQPNQPLTIMPVIMASLVPSLIGSVAFFLIGKFTNNGYRIFSVLAVVLAVLSLFSPFKVPVNITLSYLLMLCVMHLVVALVLVYFIGQRKQQQAQVDA